MQCSITPGGGRKQRRCPPAQRSAPYFFACYSIMANPTKRLLLPNCLQIDLWSLGCILAELATGRVLFQVGLRLTQCTLRYMVDEDHSRMGCPLRATHTVAGLRQTWAHLARPS